VATEKQTNANRENAKRSTGPKTPEGKARVRYNAMQHGLLAEAALLPDEDEATFRSFSKKITEECAPVGEMESLLVEQIINTAWRLRRLSQVETGLFLRETAAQAEEHFRAEALALETSFADFLAEQSVYTSRQPIRIADEERHQGALDHADTAAAVQQTELARLGGSFARGVQAGDFFSKLARYETTLNRTFERSMKQLDELQRQRRPAEPEGSPKAIVVPEAEASGEMSDDSL
jgi:hypothetical protein